jgi:hypothetical protein
MSIHKRPQPFYSVRNKITGETYETSDRYPKKMIEGVEFTAVIKGSPLLRPVPSWVRSDSLVRVHKSLISKE